MNKKIEKELFMKRTLYLLIISLFCLPFVTGCAGTRNAMTLENLEYPVSMSPVLYGPNNEVLVKGKELSTLGSFSYDKTFWGTGWSFIALSDDSDVASEINGKIKEKGGDGLINLRATSKGCIINYVPFLNWIPIWPACTNSTITGEVVKAKMEKVN